MDVVQDLYEKLSTLSSKSLDEVKELVKKKVEELSGLVSEEGAMYVVANELGVKLEGKPSSVGSSEYKKIDEINEDKVSVSLVAKVLRKYDLKEFESKNSSSKGKVQSLLVGDETGIIRVTFWGDQVEKIQDVDRDTIVDIKNGYVRENTSNSRLEVHFSNYSDIEVNPKDVSIEVKEIRPENTAKEIQDISLQDKNISIKATIVDVDIPRFYLGCPHTYKKVFVDEGKYISPDHGEVEPLKIPITNLVVSDSTGTISIVAFRDRAEELFSKKADEIVHLAEDLEGYREISKSMVGSQVEVAGNVSENQMTGELQLIVNDVIFKSVHSIEEVADEVMSENKESTQEEMKKSVDNSEVSIDDDLDIEEIDIDDDLL